MNMQRVRTAVFIATSIDGYIARKDGGLDWLPTPDGNEDYGYHAFFNSVDALIMGRKTYDTVRTFTEWPYADKKVIVLSRQASLNPALPENAELLSMNPAELLEHLTERGMKKVYIDGGQTIQSFLRAGLIDEMIITQIPILLGRGISLFGDMEKELRCKLLGSQAYASGLVQNHYGIVQS